MADGHVRALDLWQRYAQVYDRLVTHFPPYGDVLDRLAGLVPRDLPATCRFLDAGCGTGNLAVRLAARGRVVAADYAPAMLAAARRKAADHPRLALVQADLDTPLPFANASFDMVTSIHVLYALPRPEAALREFARVLTPDGWLLTANMIDRISVPRTVAFTVRRYGLRRGTAILRHLMAVGWYNARLARWQRRGAMHHWPAEAFRGVLAEAGFQTVHQENAYVCDADLLTLARRTDRQAAGQNWP